MTKETILLFSWILFASFGCGKDCDTKYSKSNYNEGLGIVASYDSIHQRINYDTLDGPFLLFQYASVNGFCEHGFNGSWVERLTFAVPDSLSEFKLVDSAIFKTHVKDRGRPNLAPRCFRCKTMNRLHVAAEVAHHINGMWV